MKVLHLRSVVFLAAGLVAFATMPVAIAGSDAQGAVQQDTPMSIATLRQFCRSNSAVISPEPDNDASAILQQQEKARAACDHFVNFAGLQGHELAEALLDRADLNAPGEDDAYRHALGDYAVLSQ